MNERPDAFVLGQDPEGGKEEAIDGCAQCHRSWPSVRFSRAVAAYQLGEPSKPILCDSCWPSELSTAIAEKIDEAQGAISTPLIRSVEVAGIESKTNVASFKYVTHIGDKEIPLTLLNVAFKGKEPGEFTWYTYKDVPTATCEAWFAAPSHGESFGTFFAREIKHSYLWEKKA